jgi:hypothetical protein
MHLVLRKIIEEHNHITTKVSIIFLARIIFLFIVSCIEWPSLVGRTVSFTCMLGSNHQCLKIRSCLGAYLSNGSFHQEAEKLLNLNANKKMIKDKLAASTGKAIVLKDLSNIRLSMNAEMI